MMKRVLLSSFLILFLISCGGNNSNQTSNSDNVNEHKDDDTNQETSPNNDKQELSFKIDNQEYGVYWSDNKTVDTLKSLVINELTIEMHRYGDFEQVGDIGYEIPTSDERPSTDIGSPGNCILYHNEGNDRRSPEKILIDNNIFLPKIWKYGINILLLQHER